MLEQRTPSAFEKNPSGGYVAGEQWFYFGFEGDLYGYSIWGQPSANDIHALVSLLVRELERPPHVAVVDLGELGMVLPESFNALAQYTIDHAEGLSRVVTRTLIVRPEGVNGAIVSGFFDIATRPFPVSFFSSLEEVFASLGSPALAEEILATRAQVSKQPELLRALRTYVSAELAQASIEAAASAFGISARTLQRRLAEHGSTFEAELHQARIRAAERLLDQTDVPITTLALELGFSSPQHFSTLFRRHTGRTPTEFRAEARAGLRRA